MGRNKRILCVFFPSFRLQAIARKDKAIENSPIVLYRNTRSGMRVLEVSQEAFKLGIRSGMTVAQARVRSSELKEIESDEKRDTAHLREVAESMQSLSPVVALSTPNALWCDMTGLDHLFSCQRTMQETLLELMAIWGFNFRATLSCSAISAWAVSVHGRLPWVELSEEDVLSAIGCLPVEALDIPSQVSEGLRKVGLCHISDVQSCEKPSLMRRYGIAGERIFNHSRGIDCQVLEPYRPLPSLDGAVEFQEPCTDLNSLLFAAKRLLDSLQERMRSRGNAASRLCWLIKTEEQQVSGQLALPRPQTSSQVLLSVLREKLSAVKLTAPIELLSLSIPEVTQGGDEIEDLFDRRVSSAERLDALLVRLESSLGPGSVCSPRPASTHRPESGIQMVPFQPRPRGRDKMKKKEWHKPDERLRPLCLLPRPESVGWTIGSDTLFISCGQRGRFPVHAISGYERIVGEWWSDGFERDYHRILLDSGILWWVFRDLRSNQWFLHGIFD